MSGSFFGWYPNPGGAIDPYTRGYATLRYGFYPIEGALDLAASHGVQVARAALSQNPNLKIVPLGDGACFEHFDEWHGQAADAVRVTSAWAGRAVMASHDDVLWVSAAGNSQGTSVDSPSYLCPQSLSGNDNVVVVAASDGDALASYSDYGARYAETSPPTVRSRTRGGRRSRPRGSPPRRLPSRRSSPTRPRGRSGSRCSSPRGSRRRSSRRCAPAACSMG